MKFNTEIIMPTGALKENKTIVKIELKGSLDNNNTPDFEFFVNTMIIGGVKKILIDINDLQYVDSTGIGSLITVTKKLRKDNGDVAITRYTAQVMTILKPINMEKFIQFFSTIDDGVKYLKSL
jgi:anti-sigma B factor antagonist